MYNSCCKLLIGNCHCTGVEIFYLLRSLEAREISIVAIKKQWPPYELLENPGYLLRLQPIQIGVQWSIRVTSQHHVVNVRLEMIC